MHKWKFSLRVRHSAALQALLILLDIWVVRFWRSGEFGLYADDYSRIPLALAKSGNELITFMASNADRLIGRARPLHEISIFVFAFLGSRMAGLQGMYILAFMIIAINSILFFKLLLRIAPREIALLATLCFALYPADTTQTFLTLAFGGQLSIMFVLLALHTYLSGRKRLSYLLVFGSLLCYETAFPPFLVAPLLAPLGKRTPLRRLAGHALIMSLMLAISISVRILAGDNRFAELALLPTLRSSLYHMAVGPVVSLGTYLYRPIQAVQRIGAAFAPQTLILASSLTVLFFGRRIMPDRQVLPDPPANDTGHPDGRAPVAHMPFSRLMLIGAALLILAYPLALTVRAYAISGRDTRVHLAGSIGAAVIMGGLLWLFMQWMTRMRKRSLGISLVLLLFLLLGIFGGVVQADYADAWRLQQRLWRDIVRLAPDLADGVGVFIEPSGLIDTKQIDANTWNLPYIFPYLFEFPQSWDRPPRAYRLLPNWEETILSETGEIQANFKAILTSPSNDYGMYDRWQVILLKTDQGHAMERAETILTANGSLQIRPANTFNQPELEPGVLYSFLISDVEEH